jgi:hypothetical protein
MDRATSSHSRNQRSLHGEPSPRVRQPARAPARILSRAREVLKPFDTPPQQGLDQPGHHVADSEPHDVWRRAVEQGELTEVAVLGDDDVAALSCVLPDLPIRSRVQTDLGNMDALGILVGESTHE